MNIQEITDTLAKILSTFPKFWKGKQAILEMKDNGYPHWRQNEWIGFYFQYLCDKNLAHTGMKIPGTKFGRAEFDGNLKIDWDFKAHPIFNKDGKKNDKLIVNDMEATTATLNTNGKVGLIVSQGIATFNDTDMTFRSWHKKLKGGDSAYSLSNIARGASKRLYKVAFEVKRIDIYILHKDDIAKQSSFQKGMRNSNGNPRRAKLQIDLSTITPAKTIIF